MEKKKANYFLRHWQFWTFLVILLLWGATFMLNEMGWKMDKKGQFGDMFGAVNALFSGLAFWGLIITIRQQKEDLNLQSKELKETKEEFRNQNFQTTFFNLLRTQRELINEFHLHLIFLNEQGDEVFRKVDGRGLFRAMKKELRKIFDALEIKEYSNYNPEKIDYNIESFGEIGSKEQADKLADYIMYESQVFTLHHYGINKVDFEEYKAFEVNQTIERVQFAYRHLFQKYNYAIGHYFRHFYHLLRFLEKSEEASLNAIVDENERNQKAGEIHKEFLEYVEFIKAQVDIPELLLLYYNSLNYKKAENIYTKYQIFDILHVGDLISNSHNLIPQYNLLKN